MRARVEVFYRKLRAAGRLPSLGRQREGNLHLLGTLSMSGTVLGSFMRMIWFKNCSKRQILLHNFAYKEWRFRNVVRVVDRHPVSKGW